MYTIKNEFSNLIDSRFNSTGWGILGKEKYTYSEKQQMEKQGVKIFENIPDRIKIALRFSYGISDLKACASPVSEIEFKKILAIYKDALEYTCQISDEGLHKLVQELYFINKTASEIPGFTKGKLINESMETEIWRKYFYLDFFKFSSINMLMRESIDDIVEYSNELLTSKFILAYFMGTGSFIEKASVLFPNKTFKQIIGFTKNICKKIELYPEFPDIQYQNYYDDYLELLNYVKINRQNVDSVIVSNFSKKRFDVFNECNHYYTKYYELKYSENIFLLFKKKPLRLLIELYDNVLKSNFEDTNEVLIALRVIRALIDKHYYDNSKIPEKLTIKNLYKDTNSPFFQALIYEGKILSILYQLDNPDKGNSASILFSDLVPFYALFYKKTGTLFSFDYDMPANLPRLVLAHHVHNASAEKLYKVMSINKLLLWNSEKFCPIISSTSSVGDIVIKERKNCLELGFDYYRIHARQKSNIGNQNRAMLSGLNGVGNEYYFTLNDDYFSFPDYALHAHKQIEKDNLDYHQSALAFKRIYDNVTIDEKSDAENIHYFEVKYGYIYPEAFAFQRGTSTIFRFTNGQNSVIESDGLLVDYSSKGFKSILHDNSTIFCKKQVHKRSGELPTNVHVISEGDDLIGNAKQIEKWSNIHTKVFFHFLVPALLKSFLKGETKLTNNKNFFAAFSLTAYSVSLRFMSFIFLCLPFICNSLQQGNESLFKYMSLFAMAIIANLLLLFTVYFHINGKISIAPLKLICFEPAFTIPPIKSLFKRILSQTTISLPTDKSKKVSNKNYLGIFVLLLNIFSLLTLKHYYFSSIIWPLFNIILIGVGLFMFTMHKIKPSESKLSMNYQVSLHTCFKVFIIFILLNILFFILDFDHNMKVLQLAIYFIMLYSFITLLRLMVLNFVLINKQKKHNQ